MPERGLDFPKMRTAGSEKPYSGTGAAGCVNFKSDSRALRCRKVRIPGSEELKLARGANPASVRSGLVGPENAVRRLFQIL